MADLICPDTGIGVYQIESLRELDAIAAIACWGWDDRLRDMARSPDPAIQATLDCQTNWQGEPIARLPRVSDPQTAEDLSALWSLQNAAKLALLPVNQSIAWAAVAIEWVESPSPKDYRTPFRLWPQKGGIQVAKTQAIAICLGAIAQQGRMLNLDHPATARLILPPLLQSAPTAIA